MVRANWRVGLVKINQFFSKPIGLLTAVALMLLLLFMFFAYRVGQAQRQNQDILNDTHSLVEDNKVLTERLKTLSDSHTHLIENIKQNQDQNTLILCRLFLRTNLQFQITENEEAEIERICQEQINQTSSPAPSSQSTQNFPSQNSTSQPQNTNGQGDQNPPDDGNNGNDNRPNMVEQILSDIFNFVGL